MTAQSPTLDGQWCIGAQSFDTFLKIWHQTTTSTSREAGPTGPELFRKESPCWSRIVLAKPNFLSGSARFTIFSGLVYLTGGVLLLLWPGAVQALFQERPFVGDEASLVRVLGMALVVIGWLNLFGGRSGARQVVAASVIDRITIVPLVMMPLAAMGVFPVLFLAFGLLDPILGLCAWALMRREKSAGGAGVEADR